jgi:hypothetical protein
LCADDFNVVGEMSPKHKSASARRRHRRTVSKRTKLLHLGLRSATMRPIPRS